MTDTDHLSALQISDWLDGDAPTEVADHIQACELCARRAGRAQPVGPAEPSSMPSDFDASLPERFHTTWQQRAQPPFARGQLWRLVWDTDVLLAVVWLAGEHDATVMPVSVDTHLADQLTLIVDEAVSPLGVETGVWVGCETGVSAALFERNLGQLSDETVTDLKALRSARGSEKVPRGLQRGIRPGSPLDDRAQFRDELLRQLEHVAAVSRWEPSSKAAPSLGEILDEIGMELAEIQDRLDIGPREALRLKRDGEATADQLRILDQIAAERGGEYLPSEAADAPEFTPELLDALNTPRYKPALLTRAAESSQSEREARLQAALEAHEIARAARRQDTRKEIDYDDVLDQLLL